METIAPPSEGQASVVGVPDEQVPESSPEADSVEISGPERSTPPKCANSMAATAIQCAGCPLVMMCPKSAPGSIATEGKPILEPAESAEELTFLGEELALMQLVESPKHDVPTTREDAQPSRVLSQAEKEVPTRSYLSALLDDTQPIVMADVFTTRATSPATEPVNQPVPASERELTAEPEAEETTHDYTVSAPYASEPTASSTSSAVKVAVAEVTVSAESPSGRHASEAGVETVADSADVLSAPNARSPQLERTPSPVVEALDEVLVAREAPPKIQGSIPVEVRPAPVQTAVCATADNGWVQPVVQQSDPFIAESTLPNPSPRRVDDTLPECIVREPVVRACEVSRQPAHDIAPFVAAERDMDSECAGVEPSVEAPARVEGISENRMDEPLEWTTHDFVHTEEHAVFDELTVQEIIPDVSVAEVTLVAIDQPTALCQFGDELNEAVAVYAEKREELTAEEAGVTSTDTVPVSVELLVSASEVAAQHRDVRVMAGPDASQTEEGVDVEQDDAPIALSESINPEAQAYRTHVALTSTPGLQVQSVSHLAIVGLWGLLRRRFVRSTTM